ncbi:MAG: hypothetical protein SOZ80_07645 [Prevotella sp.]|uniref:Outer membrane protein SusF domain-containing protein n=1 Tax=Prevotella sp. TaxID=59823 RepID=UPI002A2E2DAD|nr:DUF5115 domain-containing protein [Prevotella sp.]MDD7317714.1 hypothetical protein [Prevotellaceae bacterium]MDY4020629.1 hypothetical protein [Prevotella sp.]
MKKISFLILSLAGLLFTACSEDFTDWATPQSNPQEDGVQIPGVKASATGDIDLGMVEDAVPVFTLNAGELPQGYTFANARIEVLATEVNCKPAKINATLEGTVSKTDLQDYVVKVFGKKIETHKYSARVLLNAVKDGQALLVDAGVIDFSITPAPTRTVLYLFGDFSGWNADKAKEGAMFQTDVNVFAYYGRLDGNVKAWDENNLGNWDLCYNTTKDKDGSTAMTGVLEMSNGGAIHSPEAGLWKLEMNLNTMQYSWTKLENQNPSEYASIGIVGDFNSWANDDEKDVVMTQVTPHNWYASTTLSKDGGLKFRADGKWDTSWGADFTVSDAKYTAEGILNSSSNITVPAGNYSFYFNDITGMFAIISE